MDGFLYGLIVGAASVLILLLLLRLVTPILPLLFAPIQIPDQSVRESTDWINLSISSLFNRLQKPETAKKIEKAISEKINPARFHIESLNYPPQISHIATLQMKEADDLRIVVPIEWKNGPSFSFDSCKGGAGLEVDIIDLSTQMLFSWPGSSQSKVEIRFANYVKLDVSIALRVFSFLRFSLTDIPLIGTFARAVAVVALSRQAFNIDLLKPSPNGAAAKKSA